MNPSLSNEIDEALHRVGAHGMSLTRGVKDDLTFQAIVVTYDVVDTYQTEFAPGVFRKSLSQRMPRLAWAHDWADIIGVGTRVIRDDKQHLEIEFRLDDPATVPKAAQALTQLKSKSVDQVSVGFYPEQAVDVDRDGQKVLRFTEGILDEVSLVLRGAVPGAVITDTANLREKALHMIRSRAVGHPAAPAAAATIRALSNREVARIVNEAARPHLAAVHTNAHGTPWLHMGDALALAETAVREAAIAMQKPARYEPSLSEAIAEHRMAYGGSLNDALDAHSVRSNEAPSATLDSMLNDAITLARNPHS